MFHINYKNNRFMLFFMPFLLNLNYFPSYSNVSVFFFLFLLLLVFLEFEQVLVCLILIDFILFSVFLQFNNWFQEVCFETQSIFDQLILSHCLNISLLAYLFRIYIITPELQSAEQSSGIIVVGLTVNT